MPLLRKVVFYIFAVAYLVICLNLIRWMLGFVRDPATGHWVKTGLIYVSSNPPDAAVYINDRRMPENTPATIRDLPPAQYSLRIQMPEYEPWENTIPVVDRKATALENILLLPKQWKVQVLSRAPVTRLLPMPGSNFFLLATGDTVQDVLIFRLNRSFEEDQALPQMSDPDLSELFPEESIYRGAHVEEYFTVPRSPFFVLHILAGDKHKYLWIDPRDKQVHIEDISDLLPEPPQRLFWDMNDERNLYAAYSSHVNRINIKAKAIYPNISERDIPLERKLPPIPDAPKADQIFSINNDSTILFRQGNTVFLMDRQTFVQPRLTRIMTVAKGMDIVFSEKTGRMYYIDKQSRQLSSVQVLHNKPFIPKPIAETLRLKKMEK